MMAIMLPLFGKPASVLASVKGSRVAPVWRPPLTDAARDGRTDAGRDGETSFSLREPGNGTLLFLAGRVTMTRQPGRVSLAIRQTVFPSGKPPRCFASGQEKENTPYALACGGFLPVFAGAIRMRSLNG